MTKSYKDLDVYNLSYKLAMEPFVIIGNLPKEKLYTLSPQIVGSSRSICSNIVERWTKKIHPEKFKNLGVDALDSSAETQNWISFSKDCGYISAPCSNRLDQIGKIITKLHQNWKSTPRPDPSINLELPTSNSSH